MCGSRDRFRPMKSERSFQVEVVRVFGPLPPQPLPVPLEMRGGPRLGGPLAGLGREGQLPWRVAWPQSSLPHHRGCKSPGVTGPSPTPYMGPYCLLGRGCGDKDEGHGPCPVCGQSGRNLLTCPF